jgi:signal transduction histidine kinase
MQYPSRPTPRPGGHWLEGRIVGIAMVALPKNKPNRLLVLIQQGLIAILFIVFSLPCHATALRLETAQQWPSPSTLWAPPSMLAAADDAVLAADTPWQSVTLPHALPRSLHIWDPALATPKPLVHWYRLHVPADARPNVHRQERLYLPRWQTIGTLAVYVQGRLAWQSRGDGVWNSFNHPVWIDLGGLLAPGETAQIHLRMASQPGVGGALSSLWIGPKAELLSAWRWRTFWQTGLVSYGRAAFLLLSLFALALWFKYRRSQREEVRLFLLFCAMAVCQSVAVLHYLVDSEGLNMDFAWFSWIAMAAQLAALGCMFHFLCLAQGQHWPRMGRLLPLYLLAAALLAMPFWWSAYLAALPLLRLLMIPPTLLLLAAAAVGAWRLRNGSSLLLAAWGAMVPPIGLHDMAMQNYWGDIEGIYLTPYVSVGLFTLFLVIVFTRYSHAQDQAAQAHTTLAERLAAQERELRLAHERLRSVERAQTLMQERQRLMREMHDGVGSSLMSALRLVEHSQRPVNVAQVLKECIDDLKISIDSLEPVDADLLALLAGLRFRLEQRLGEAGITLHWRTNDVPPLPWLDAQSALHVLRILQEVLTNIIKHSHATNITVSTAAASQDGQPGVQVTVHDNGAPFSPPSADRLPPGRRGLGNVLSRTRVLGGACHWAAGAQGTAFTLWLPLQRQHRRGTLTTT